MKVTKIDHIGLAVKDLNESIELYTQLFGLTCSGIETVEEQKVNVAFLPLGESELELLESTSPDGPVAKFIEKNGEGIQHIALQVDDIEEALVYLKEKGIKLIDQQPRYGAGNASIAFLHPKATNGVLLELTQRK